MLEVLQAQPTVAEGVAHWVSQQAYEAIGRNCMDDVYDVLRSYGVANLPPPATHWEPNYWFDAIVGNHFSIKHKGVIWHTEGEQSPLQGPLFADEASLHLAFHAPTMPVCPAWRASDTPESAHLEASKRAAEPMPTASKGAQQFPFLGFLAKLRRGLRLPV